MFNLPVPHVRRSRSLETESANVCDPEGSERSKKKDGTPAEVEEHETTTKEDDKFDGLISMDQVSNLTPPAGSDSAKAATNTESNLIFLPNPTDSVVIPPTTDSSSPPTSTNLLATSKSSSNEVPVPLTPKLLLTELAQAQSLSSPPLTQLPSSFVTLQNATAHPQTPASQPRKALGGPSSPIENVFARMAGSAAAATSARSTENLEPKDSPVIIIDPDLLLLDRPAPPSQTLDSFNMGFIFPTPVSASVANSDTLVPGLARIDYTLSNIQQANNPNDISSSGIATNDNMTTAHDARQENATEVSIPEHEKVVHSMNERVGVAVPQSKKRGVKRKLPVAEAAVVEAVNGARPRREIKAPLRPDGQPLSPQKVAKRGSRAV